MYIKLYVLFRSAANEFIPQLSEHFEVSEGGSILQVFWEAVPHIRRRKKEMVKFFLRKQETIRCFKEG